MERAVRVLVVDDEPFIVEMLTMGLNYEGFEVSVARTGFEALDQARSVRPDLVVLDIMLPGIDGIEVCKRLREQGNMGILLLTAKGELEDRIEGLDSGADDYLVKPFSFKELMARVRAILRRNGINLQQVLRSGDVVMDKQSRKVTRGGHLVELTPREFDMLELFLTHPRQVFPREVILNRVLGLRLYGRHERYRRTYSPPARKAGRRGAQPHTKCKRRRLWPGAAKRRNEKYGAGPLGGWK